MIKMAFLRLTSPFLVALSPIIFRIKTHHGCNEVPLSLMIALIKALVRMAALQSLITSFQVALSPRIPCVLSAHSRMELSWAGSDSLRVVRVQQAVRRH